LRKDCASSEAQAAESSKGTQVFEVVSRAKIRPTIDIVSSKTQGRTEKCHMGYASFVCKWRNSRTATSSQGQCTNISEQPRRKPKSRGGRSDQRIDNLQAVKDFLLCAKCEDLFNKNGENEILKWVWNGKSFPLGDRLAVAVRCPSIHRSPRRFRGTSIGVDTENLRISH